MIMRHRKKQEIKSEYIKSTLNIQRQKQTEKEKVFTVRYRHNSTRRELLTTREIQQSIVFEGRRKINRVREGKRERVNV